VNKFLQSTFNVQTYTVVIPWSTSVALKYRYFANVLQNGINVFPVMLTLVAFMGVEGLREWWQHSFHCLLTIYPPILVVLLLRTISLVKSLYLSNGDKLWSPSRQTKKLHLLEKRSKIIWILLPGSTCIKGKEYTLTHHATKSSNQSTASMSRFTKSIFNSLKFYPVYFGGMKALPLRELTTSSSVFSDRSLSYCAIENLRAHMTFT